jgi:hypothetical protein
LVGNKKARFVAAHRRQPTAVDEAAGAATATDRCLAGLARDALARALLLERTDRRRAL